MPIERHGSSEKPDSYLVSAGHWLRGEQQALASWWRRSWRYWWSRERKFLRDMLIAFGLAGMIVTSVFSPRPGYSPEIVFLDGVRVILPINPIVIIALVATLLRVIAGWFLYRIGQRMEVNYGA